jgi:hypothetical protein
MSSIHLIKKSEAGLPQIVPVPGEPNTYTSGFWTLSEETAHTLVGGQIYFHDRQRAPAFYGGQIVAAQRAPDSDKIVFKFVFLPDHRGVRTGADGWAQEMKLVL